MRAECPGGRGHVGLIPLQRREIDQAVINSGEVVPYGISLTGTKWPVPDVEIAHITGVIRIGGPIALANIAIVADHVVWRLYHTRANYRSVFINRCAAVGLLHYRNILPCVERNCVINF